MGDAGKPQVYSIAAHRGFADALVAGLVPRYEEEGLGLARLTLLVPSSRAARTMSEAFIRWCGENDRAGMLMPRMVTVGDLNLDESLGALLDPLGASDIPPAVEPTRRLLELARLVEEERAGLGKSPLPGAARIRLASEIARTMDRLLVEGKEPEDLTSDAVLDMLGDLSGHWQDSLRLFARVQARWRSRLEETGHVDAATRRNLLFDRATKRWRAAPPGTPLIAAGVTSASPALARMLRAIAHLPNGAVILPDLDLKLPDEAWDELGRAGATPEPGGEVFGQSDALTHPQYHLKLLLQRMGIARAEVKAWHRRGITAADPARSQAISSLFLPPKASRSWVDLGPEKRRLAGVRLLTSATSEEEAQAIALLVREALDEPTKRIAVVTADRSLARRVTQHLERWNIGADDSAGRALSLTPAGRLIGLLADIMSHGLAPASVAALIAHPLVQRGDDEARRQWLRNVRKFDRALRGPTPAPGLEPLRQIAREAGVVDWFGEVETILSPLVDLPEAITLAQSLDLLAASAERLAAEAVWAAEDGRALSRMLEDLRHHAREISTSVSPSDIASILRDRMDEVAVRPPYGGHPRVAILGLLESRMARADLVICAGLNEGSWPQAPGSDALLAPGVLRVLGVPGAEFRIGLSAHDLAGAMGAPEVVLSRSLRDADGPTLPSRFILRVEALLGELADRHRDDRTPAILPLLDREPEPAPNYPRPRPKPSAAQRKVRISATAIDRLLGDPYQFYAQEILSLRRLDPLAADPFGDPALRGTLVHDILDAWHKAREANPSLEIAPFAERMFAEAKVHPLFKGLWQPRLIAAMERFEQWVDEAARDGRTVLVTETKGEMVVDGITVSGRADRIDRCADGQLVVVDYKTGGPASASQVEAGYALQMGILGLIARDGAFEKGKLSGEVATYEYWSLGRSKDDGEFGYQSIPLKMTPRQKGLTPEKFLPTHEEFLSTAINKYILGDAPFTAKENPDYPGYSDYDQLMRLEEWIVRLGEDGEGAS
ncbi:double-strand break repair protein AddB [Erythrobacter sp. KY5]|uniref:PD-(D/E)XK nuclease family protein n=1 Tax=Erythrobacter sp. KY5 TaxID=2011159 RepID=UPI000DBF39AF|nr:PD-(D/E)XK nuclease family protein [Erythrobacter sp. KY5]AWW74543.1 double-strand break repair protein AddB [Erythrobacter sp. KY5]